MSEEPRNWQDDQPIYRQLIHEVIAGILDETYPEGELLPSVRQLAEQYQVNPLTAAKAYKELARDGLTEKRRGEGLAVRPGVREALMQRERAKFLTEEWPLLRARLRRMEIDLKDLASS
jgi:GntR family transcriptional regulator